MNQPESFKYDVRVRARMMDRGAISDEEIAKHLSALPDLEKRAVTLVLEQPALMHEKEPPEELPMAGIGGLGASGLSPIEPAPPVHSLDPHGYMRRGPSYDPMGRVSPYDPAPRVSALDPAPKVNPFEPTRPLSPYDPAPRVSPYGDHKVNPFEPAPKVSPFEPRGNPYGQPPGYGQPQYASPYGAPPVAPQVPGPYGSMDRPPATYPPPGAAAYMPHAQAGHLPQAQGGQAAIPGPAPVPSPYGGYPPPQYPAPAHPGVHHNPAQYGVPHHGAAPHVPAPIPQPPPYGAAPSPYAAPPAPPQPQYYPAYDQVSRPQPLNPPTPGVGAQPLVSPFEPPAGVPVIPGPGFPGAVAGHDDDSDDPFAPPSRSNR